MWLQNWVYSNRAPKLLTEQGPGGKWHAMEYPTEQSAVEVAPTATENKGSPDVQVKQLCQEYDAALVSVIERDYGPPKFADGVPSF